MTSQKAIIIQVLTTIRQGIELTIALHFGIEASACTNKEKASFLTFHIDEEKQQEFLTYLQQKEQQHLLRIITSYSRLEFTQEDLYVLQVSLEKVLSSCGSDSEWKAVFLERTSALHSRIEELSDKSVTFNTLLAQGKKD